MLCKTKLVRDLFTLLSFPHCKGKMAEAFGSLGNIGLRLKPVGMIGQINRASDYGTSSYQFSILPPMCCCRRIHPCSFSETFSCKLFFFPPQFRNRGWIQEPPPCPCVFFLGLKEATIFHRSLFHSFLPLLVLGNVVELGLSCTLGGTTGLVDHTRRHRFRIQLEGARGRSEPLSP